MFCFFFFSERDKYADFLSLASDSQNQQDNSSKILDACSAELQEGSSFFSKCEQEGVLGEVILSKKGETYKNGLEQICLVGERVCFGCDNVTVAHKDTLNANIQKLKTLLATVDVNLKVVFQSSIANLVGL